MFSKVYMGNGLMIDVTQVLMCGNACHSKHFLCHFYTSYGKIKTTGLGMMKHFFLVRSGTQKGFQVLCIDSTNPLVVCVWLKISRGLSFFRALTSFWLTKKPWFQLL